MFTKMLEGITARRLHFIDDDRYSSRGWYSSIEEFSYVKDTHIKEKPIVSTIFTLKTKS